ncbi:MAG: response regulator [Oligoflexia bacterium]|nr:response regulator [Oligoflexia bacterium]
MNTRNSANNGTNKKLGYLLSCITAVALLCPIYIYFIGDRKNFIFVGIPCMLASIIIAFQYLRIRTNKSVLMAFGFLLLAFADLITSITAIYPKKMEMIPVYYSEFSYLVFMAILLLYIASIIKYPTKRDLKIIDGLIALLVFFFAAYGSYTLILQKALISYTIVLKCTEVAYSLLQALCLALLVPLGLRSKNIFQVIFSGLVIIMFAADFGARYAWSTNNERALAYGSIWAICLIGIAILTIFPRSTSILTADSYAESYLSLRTLPTLVLLLCLPTILFVFNTARLVSHESIFNTIDIIIMIAFCAFFFNLVSLFISRTVSNSCEIISIRHSSEELSDHDYLKIHFATFDDRSRLLEEFNLFADKFDILSATANQLVAKLIVKSQLASIASTTQMLAHDVRKPFSLLSSILCTLENKNMDELTSDDLAMMLDDVQMAMTRVNGMIQDVMETGPQSVLTTSPTSIVTLVEMNLTEIVRLLPDADISFSFDFDSQTILDVDPMKVPRVLANIISNAFEAMGLKGKIWFSCRAINNKFAQITIGNDGPLIPQSVLANLFNNFFTSGKQGGVGLGLAIAKKIVEAHGGKIACTSTEESGTEFIFTLPLAKEQRPPELSYPLPQSSKQLYEKITRLRNKNMHTNIGQESYLERMFLAAAIKSAKKARLLIVDDEIVYQQVLVNMLHKNPEIKSLVEIKTASSFEESLKQIAEFSPDLITLDIDLGTTSKNGLEILTQARFQGYKGHICLHSNRKINYAEAVLAGADSVEAKPMSRSALLGMLKDIFMQTSTNS